MSTKRVLIFLPCFTHGGAERQGALLARYLRDEGHDVEVWGFPSLAASAPLKATLDSWGLAYQELPAWPRLDWSFSRQPLTIRRVARRYIRWPQQLAAAERILPKRKFDVVVPFTPRPCLVSVLLRRHFGARAVVWNHRGGFDPGGIDFSPFIVKALVSQHPTFVANSNAGAEFIRRTFGLAAGEVQVIRNAFIPERDDDGDSPATNARPAQPLRLVQLANFFDEKDGETLLRAVHLLNSTGVQCQLHLAGHFPDPNYKLLLERTTLELRIQDHVTFHGALDRDQVHRLLKDADIGLLSSRSEGMPNSIMEYMYWRLPVVATDIPGIREIVGEENGDWLFPVGDFVRLAHSIERLARDSQLRSSLGAANRQRIVEEFGADKILPQWQRLILAH